LSRRDGSKRRDLENRRKYLATIPAAYVVSPI
jgi:hypothetical protein